MRARQGGFTLVLSVIVVVFLMVVVAQVRYTTRVEWILTMHAQDGVASSYTGRCAIPLVLEKLRLDAAANQTDSENDIWAKEMTALQVAGQSISIKVVDEDGKFNINYLIDADGRAVDSMREAFLRLIESLEFDYDDWQEMEDLEDAEELVDKIIDYIDEDKSGLYENKGQNPNRPLMSLDELLNIEGITPEFLYGEEDPFDQEEALRMQDEDPYGYMDDIHNPNSPYYDEDAEPFEGLFHYITVNSGGPININTAEPPALVTLSPKFTREIADAVVNYRKTSRENEEGKTDEFGEVKMVYEVFANVNDLTKIKDVDEAKIKELLDEIAPAKKGPGAKNGNNNGNNNNNDNNNNNGNNNQNGQQQQQRRTEHIDVKSRYFKAIVETNIQGVKEVYIGLFHRDDARVRLVSWERNVGLPKRAEDDDKYQDDLRADPLKYRYK